MHPILLEINGFTLHTYGTVMALAFALCLIPLTLRFPRHLFSLTDLYNFCLIILLVIFVGNSLLQYSYYHLLGFERGQTLAIDELINGRGSYPALITTLILLYLYCRLRQIPVLPTLDVLIPYAILLLAIQRTFGCFMAGCCYGTPTNLPWGITFPLISKAGQAFPGISIHPTQLYYGISAFGIWIFWLIYQRHYAPKTGKITAIGLGLLALTYFWISFLRGEVSKILGLTLSQYASIILIVFATLLYLRQDKHIT